MGRAADIVRQYVALYSDGTPEAYGSDRFLSLFAEHAECSVAPTPDRPAGEDGGIEIFTRGLALSEPVLRNRRIDLVELIEAQSRVAWTGVWTATVGVDGLPMPRGHELRVHMAAFTEVEDGLIVRHREYLTTPEGADA